MAMAAGLEAVPVMAAGLGTVPALAAAAAGGYVRSANERI